MKPWARKQIKGATNGRKKKTRNPRPGKDADVERPAGNEPMAKSKDPFFTSRVRIEITHYRCRLCDPGGPSSKAVLDGIVRAGILRDDSLLWIEEPIIERQEKVKNQEDEETIIIIEEV
jgi:hypothetical protein